MAEQFAPSRSPLIANAESTQAIYQDRMAARMRALFQAMQELVFVIDNEGRFTEYFQPHNELLHASPQTFLGKTYHEILPAHIAELLRSTIAQVGSTNQAQRMEYDIATGDKTRHFAATVSILPALTGDNPEYLIVTRDISPQHQYKQQLEQARDAAERADRAKSEFLANMSHELRTPMNAILGFTQLLQLDKNLNQEQTENLTEIHNAADHLLELINDVLDLSRIEADNIVVEPADIPLDEVIDECVRFIEGAASKRQVTVSKTEDFTAGIRIVSDRVRLKQILLNLLSNAIKYNVPGGKVQIQCRRTGDRVKIAVIDTGIGIDPIHQNALFTPFNRLGAENSEIEGTGIGLVITRKLALRLNGTINMQSSPGNGSTFWIELPVAMSGPRENQSSSDDGADHDTGPSGRKLGATVLYIEDDLVNQQLMRKVFEHRPNLTLLFTGLPESGIELARRHIPDLILLDINLPGTDGFALLKILRDDPLTRDIPVVAVSADALPATISRGMSAGFLAYLTKPLNMPDLFAVLDNIPATNTSSK